MNKHELKIDIIYNIVYMYPILGIFVVDLVIGSQIIF